MSLAIRTATIHQPFARWENIEACKLEQKQFGHTDKAAESICEEIQDRAVKGTLYKSLPGIEILKSVDGELIIGGPASWEVIDEENDYITTEAMVNFMRKFFALPPEYRNISIDHSNFQMAVALLQYPEENPKYFSHVHEKGMYLIAKVRDDSLQRTLHYRGLIKDGTYKMYSISGEPMRHEKVLMDKKVVRKVYDIDPFEVAIVKEGMNQRAGPLQVLKQKPEHPTEKDRLVNHYGEEIAIKLIGLIGLEEAVKLLPARQQLRQKMQKSDIEKKVVQRGSQWCVVHCHEDGSIGETIKCFPTKEEADAMHRAIQANKSLSKDDRPPKEWMDNCRAKAQSFADDPDAFCGDLWFNGPADKRDAFGKTLSKSKELPFQQEAEQIFRKYFPEYRR